MIAQIIRIGNSRGIRIPKPLLDQAGIRGAVEIEVRRGALIIRPVADPRAGWAKAFKQLARKGGDKLVDDPALTPTAFDQGEWE